jgi:hypothetical protein
VETQNPASGTACSAFISLMTAFVRKFELQRQPVILSAHRTEIDVVQAQAPGPRKDEAALRGDQRAHIDSKPIAKIVLTGPFRNCVGVEFRLEQLFATSELGARLWACLPLLVRSEKRPSPTGSADRQTDLDRRTGIARIERFVVPLEQRPWNLDIAGRRQ